MTRIFILDPPLDSWKPTASDFFIEGSRIEAAFRKYIHRADPKQNHDSVDVLVCHGNVIRYFVCRALQFAPEAWLRFAVHNGSITVMQVNKKGDVIVTALGIFFFIKDMNVFDLRLLEILRLGMETKTNIFSFR